MSIKLNTVNIWELELKDIAVIFIFKFFEFPGFMFFSTIKHLTIF
jgi:hypothetical protein